MSTMSRFKDFDLSVKESRRQEKNKMAEETKPKRIYLLISDEEIVALQKNGLVGKNVDDSSSILKAVRAKLGLPEKSGFRTPSETRKTTMVMNKVAKENPELVKKFNEFMKKQNIDVDKEFKEIVEDVRAKRANKKDE